MKWRNSFYQANVVFIKKKCNFFYLNSLDFRAWLGMQINDLLQIENIDTLCCCKLKILIPCVVTTSVIRQNMYDIQILWLIGLISELKMGIVFQHTELQLRSWCMKYIFILNTIFTTHVQKKFTFQKTSIICF